MPNTVVLGFWPVEDEGERVEAAIVASAGGVLSRKTKRDAARCRRRRPPSGPAAPSLSSWSSLPTARQLRRCRSSKKRKRATEEKHSAWTLATAKSIKRTARLATFSLSFLSPASLSVVQISLSLSRALFRAPCRLVCSFRPREGCCTSHPCRRARSLSSRRAGRGARELSMRPLEEKSRAEKSRRSEDSSHFRTFRYLSLTRLHHPPSFPKKKKHHRQPPPPPPHTTHRNDPASTESSTTTTTSSRGPR